MKNISIFGKGNMAKALEAVFTKAGNSVSLISRDEQANLGDIVILAVPYASVAEIIEKYRESLIGKIIVDITNPVDFGTMDNLVIQSDTSAAEIIAQALPQSHILKAFNTNFAATLASQTVGNQPTNVLIAGDSNEAKSTLTAALNGSGLNVKDAGSLKRARELEAFGFLAITLAVREQIGWTGGFALFE